MRSALLTLAAVLLVAVGVGGYRAGFARGALSSYRTRTDTLRVEIARLDTVYQRDTVVFWRLKRQTDTLVRVDSIPVIARDSSRADSSLRALSSALSVCSSVLLTCEARIEAERQLRVAAESTLYMQAFRGRRLPIIAVTVGILTGAFSALLLSR
jgi:hypothetical protein